MCVAVSDLHLREKVPVARKEKDWYKVMERYLKQFQNVVTAMSVKIGRPIPVVYAGDIFDKWNSPAELINFAITHLPKGYGIPGQHDLSNHNYEDIRKTSYWTLCEAKVIEDLGDNKPLAIPGFKYLILHPFPWGRELTPNKLGPQDAIHLAVVHKYLWKDLTNCYKDAPLSENFSKVKDNLKGYSAAVFGDNHTHFQAQRTDGCKVFNNGGFMCWRSDEKDYKPGCGVLYSDGTWQRHTFDTSKDEWMDAEEVKGMEESGETAADFLEELAKLGDKAIDFARVLRNEAGKLPPDKFRVKDILLKALEKKDG